MLYHKPSVDSFKCKLYQFWFYQDVKYDYTLQLN